MKDIITVPANGYKSVIERQTDLLFSDMFGMNVTLAKYDITHLIPITAVMCKHNGQRVNDAVIEFARANPQYGITFEEEKYDTYQLAGDAENKIKQIFVLQANTFVETWTDRIRIKTYNLKPEEHKAEIRKLYRPLKKQHPDLVYTCHRETASSECRVNH